MANTQQRESIRKFINEWTYKGYEKGETQQYWIAFLQDVLGIDNAIGRIVFEIPVLINKQQSYIDAYIPETRVLIEQKNVDKDLLKSYPQSGGIMNRNLSENCI